MNADDSDQAAEKSEAIEPKETKGGPGRRTTPILDYKFVAGE
jgi:hypothetical protein